MANGLAHSPDPHEHVIAVYYDTTRVLPDHFWTKAAWLTWCKAYSRSARALARNEGGTFSMEYQPNTLQARARIESGYDANAIEEKALAAAAKAVLGSRGKRTSNPRREGKSVDLVIRGVGRWGDPEYWHYVDVRLGDPNVNADVEDQFVTATFGDGSYIGFATNRGRNDDPYDTSIDVFTADGVGGVGGQSKDFIDRGDRFRIASTPNGKGLTYEQILLKLGVPAKVAAGEASESNSEP